MDTTAISIIALAVFLWSIVSARLQRADLTAPIVFVATGWSLTAMGLVDPPPLAAETFKPLVEFTLVWVLFSDAAGVSFDQVRHDRGRYLRLLAAGLPLTVLSGWALANWLFPHLGIYLALLVGAALAPTDAALGLPITTNPAVPAGVRQVITVESGLNDGIVTPVVMFALAGAASAEGAAGAPGPWGVLAELGIGVTVGTVIGLAGGWSLRWTRRRGWAAGDFAGIAVLALTLVAYTASLGAHGNGFVAAFCGGLAFGAAAGPRGPAELVFTEQVGSLASLFIWLGFGALAVPGMVGQVQLSTAIYAILSLTLVRMVPVALACARAGLDRETVLFIGWFGPRGLASLAFALLAVEELGTGADEAVAVIGVTVFTSVLLHGLSAGPLSSRYGSVVTRRR
ncbi:cation:proton antiporter domain-containing protein [Planomonospora parontospora]|uniref:cation:proton antiporter domain-containing protein n=1 Tax=Planomonospora parontospora TaxID=58119 RepID=UPI001943F19B|nr:cation:proton antiporter [Planomonospora parontospora]GGL15156.1 sodium:proton antiporter [Planomonospora parontospora subsp. antibiotica]GII15924.1 sodium:proton antiporter [Planomonospora parontospora subsp. antibiotica]